MPDDLEINCTLILNSKWGYCLNRIMNENKIEEMMEKLFEKTNTLLEGKMSKIESSINNIKHDINTTWDDLKTTSISYGKTLTTQKIRPKHS